MTIRGTSQPIDSEVPLILITYLFTFLGTSLRLAAIGVDDSDTSDFVRHSLSTGW